MQAICYTYLDDCSPCHNTKRSVHLTIWIFLHTNYVQVERTFKFRVCHMSFGETQTSGPNEPFILWWLPCKSRTNKGSFSYHSLPLLGCIRRFVSAIWLSGEEITYVVGATVHKMFIKSTSYKKKTS